MTTAAAQTRVCSCGTAMMEFPGTEGFFTYCQHCDTDSKFSPKKCSLCKTLMGDLLDK